MMLWLFCVLTSLVGFLTASDEQTITAESGQDSVTLPCKTGKETEIIVVEWRRPDLRPDYVLVLRDDQLYLDDQNPSFMNRVDLQERQMKDGDASLILKDVKINDAGTYLCRVYQGGGNRRKRAAKEISSIHLVVSPTGTQEGGGKEGGQAGRGHLGLVLVVVLVASVLGIVAVIAAVLIHKRKKTPPPPDEGAPVQPLV